MPDLTRGVSFLDCQQGAEAYEQAKAEAEAKRREAVKAAVIEQPRDEQGRMTPKAPDDHNNSGHPGERPRNRENQAAHALAKQAGIGRAIMELDCQQGADAHEAAKKEAAERKKAANAEKAAEQKRDELGRMVASDPGDQIKSGHPNEIQCEPRQRNNENRATAILAAKAGVGRATMEKVESLVRARPGLRLLIGNQQEGNDPLDMRVCRILCRRTFIVVRSRVIIFR